MGKDTKVANEYTERALWVLAVIDALRPDFAEAGLPLPDKVRVGFSTKGQGTGKTGEAWHSPASRDGAFELFVRADQDDPLEVAIIAMRQLVHIALPADDSHGKRYRAAAAKVGLVGKMRSASPNHLLKARLQGLVASLGPLPHAALDLSWRPFVKKKQQGPGMLKAFCTGGVDPETEQFDACGYTFRLSTKWTALGAHCPRHGVMTIEFPEDAEPESPAAEKPTTEAEPRFEAA